MPVNGREWDDDPVHDDVDANSVEEPGDYRTAGEKRQLATCQEEYGGSAERDKEMKEEAESGGRRTALKRPRAEKAARDPLQHPNRTAVPYERDDDGR